jgi:hypothetical protein
MNNSIYFPMSPPEISEDSLVIHAKRNGLYGAMLVDVYANFLVPNDADQKEFPHITKNLKRTSCLLLQVIYVIYELKPHGFRKEYQTYVAQLVLEPSTGKLLSFISAKHQFPPQDPDDDGGLPLPAGTGVQLAAA